MINPLGFRIVGILPPEPLPDRFLIPDEKLKITHELLSADNRFLVRITRDENSIYRARSFAWITQADDDVWAAFWSEHALGTLSDTVDTVLAEAQRQVEAYDSDRARA
jgi:hypothetical protein